MKRMVTLDTATHIAGPIIKIRVRAIQRCLICGEKLGDNADQRLSVFWCEGEMVQISRHAQASSRELRHSGDFLNTKKLPRDFCLSLVEL